MRPAARSANKRSSIRSSSAGSYSATCSARSSWARASSSAVSAVSIAFTAGSIKPGAWAARRSRRRTAVASGATGEFGPLTASCVARKSSATFSACIIPARRSASEVSSPICGLSRPSSSTAWRSHSASRLGAFDVGAMALDGNVAGAPLVPQPRHFRGVGVDPAIGVEQRAVRCGIDEGAFVMLAVNLDQSRAERAQHLHADRLVVDERASPAVGELRPPHDQLVLADKIVVGQHAARRMVFGDIEGGDHLAVLGALAHQSRIAAGAEREREGVEQDRFAGTGLAGQRGETGSEIDIEPVDQNDVAD